jgi:Lrp/AsnC family transcriptional regulator for asnA, asnC and gidA
MANEKEPLPDIDKTDLAILTILMKDAKTPFTKVAEQIPVSGGTVHVRMRKLEKMGIVKGTYIEVDPVKLGFDLTAFIGIYLEKGSHYKDVVADLREIPEVVEAHYLTGEYSIFVKMVARNTNHLRSVLNDRIQAIDGVVRTETFISMEESIKRPLDVGNLVRPSND